MDSSVNTFPRFERAGFATMGMIAGAMLFLVGAAPRTERALLLKDVDAVPAKAFSAVVPPLDAERAQIERSLIAYGSAARGPRLTDAGIAGRRPLQFLASNQPLVPGAFGTPLTTGGSLSDEQTPSSGLLPTNTGSQAAGIGSAAGPGGSAPTTPTGSAPATPGLPGPIAGAPAVDTPVSAVPEPTTWAMMLLGFLAIGVSIRRRPARSIAKVTRPA